MSDHLPEPWKYSNFRQKSDLSKLEHVILDARGQIVLVDVQNDIRPDVVSRKADFFRRVVACVNLLRGVPTDTIEKVAKGDRHQIEIADYVIRRRRHNPCLFGDDEVVHGPSLDDLRNDKRTGESDAQIHPSPV